jgi:hypothetical protein
MHANRRGDHALDECFISQFFFWFSGFQIHS